MYISRSGWNPKTFPSGALLGEVSAKETQKKCSFHKQSSFRLLSTISIPAIQEEKQEPLSKGEEEKQVKETERE